MQSLPHNYFPYFVNHDRHIIINEIDNQNNSNFKNNITSNNNQVELFQ